MKNKDIKKTSFEDIEENFEDTEIFEDFESTIFDNIDLLNDVFEGDIDLYQNYLEG